MTEELVLLGVVGARPQFVKAAAIHAAIQRQGRGMVREVIVHTGQHYDYELSEAFFDDFSLPPPDAYLGVGSGPHGRQTGEMLTRLEPVMARTAPDVVVVYGDTNSTLAGALAAAKLDLPIAHVEAGMRAGRRDMPEEINRIVADHVSTLLFCPTQKAANNLEREGITDGVFVCGDVMYEILQRYLPSSSAERLHDFGVEPNRYVLATVHRAENTDDADRLIRIMHSLEQIGRHEPVLLPAHPRTRKALSDVHSFQNVRLLEPVRYGDMLSLQRFARVVVTDSGGVQKEAFWLGVPCVTLREETEWPETLEDGWNILAGADPETIVAAASRPAPAGTRANDLSREGASEHIVDALSSWHRERGGVGERLV